MVPEYEIVEEGGLFKIIWNTFDGNDPVKRDLCVCGKQEDAERIVKALDALSNVENFILFVQGYEP